MKANELMFNNWVRYGEKYVRVKSIHPIHATIVVCIDGEDEYLDENLDNIEPIRITPELLEKNGWKNHKQRFGDKNLRYWTSPDGRIELRCNTNRDWCNSDADWAVHIDNNACETIGSGVVTYLHELQNEFNCKHYEFEWQL